MHILRQDDEKYVVKDEGNHPLVDYILMNSAALAVVAGEAQTWKEGVVLAKESIKSGKALQALEDLKKAINV